MTIRANYCFANSGVQRLPRHASNEIGAADLNGFWVARSAPRLYDRIGSYSKMVEAVTVAVTRIVRLKVGSPSPVALLPLRQPEHDSGTSSLATTRSSQLSYCRERWRPRSDFRRHYTR